MDDHHFALYEEVKGAEFKITHKAFNLMREELWTAQIRNAHKKMNYDGNNIGDKVVAIKRETNENTEEISYEFNITILEKMFFEYHPSLDVEDIVWKEVESLTPKVLERICTHDILLKMLPRPPLPEEQPVNISAYGYLPVQASELQKDRVIKDAILLMRNRKKEVKITALRCKFEKFVIPITQATGDRVFTLFPELKPNRFKLRGGTYLVHYN